MAIGLVRLNFLRGSDWLDWLDKNFEWRWLDKFLILVVAISFFVACSSTTMVTL